MGQSTNFNTALQWVVAEFYGIPDFYFIRDRPKSPISPLNNMSQLRSIVEEEQATASAAHRRSRRPLHIIQREERAMQVSTRIDLIFTTMSQSSKELRAAYNADSLDEWITVERLDRANSAVGSVWERR